MQEIEVFDLVIVGAGQAADPLAHAAKKKGWNVAVIERKKLGGSCVNFGCTPSKAAISSAKLVHDARRASDFGFQIPGFKVDFAGVMESAHAVAEESRTGLEEGYEGEDAPTLIRGHARLNGKEGDLFVLEVEGRKLFAKKVVLDTGTRSKMPPIEGLKDSDWFDAGNWIDRRKLPNRLAVIGGGVVSLELAQFFSRMGSKVTIIESGPRLAKTEDEEIAECITKNLEAEGIQVRTSLKLMKVAKIANGYALSCGEGENACVVETDTIFVAIGRTPNIDDLGLDTLGIKPNDKGLLDVDEHLQTSVAGVYATGDIRPGGMFTHTSWDDFRILMTEFFQVGNHTTNRLVPYGVFVDPELGRVGPNEDEARKQGLDFDVMRFEVKHNGLARERRETKGLVKVLVDKEKQTIIGAAILSAQAADLIAVFQMMMLGNHKIDLLREAVITHPTFVEGLQSALESS